MDRPPAPPLGPAPPLSVRARAAPKRLRRIHTARSLRALRLSFASRPSLLGRWSGGCFPVGTCAWWPATNPRARTGLACMSLCAFAEADQAPCGSSLTTSSTKAESEKLHSQFRIPLRIMPTPPKSSRLYRKVHLAPLYLEIQAMDYTNKSSGASSNAAPTGPFPESTMGRPHMKVLLDHMKGSNRRLPPRKDRRRRRPPPPPAGRRHPSA